MDDFKSKIAAATLKREGQGSTSLAGLAPGGSTWVDTTSSGNWSNSQSGPRDSGQHTIINTRPFHELSADFTNAADAIAAYQNAYDNPTHDEWTSGVWGGSVLGLLNVYHMPGYKLGKVDIAAQEQRPENPGIREVAFSTYGINIPVSIGKRAVTGNIIDATPPTPEIVGAYEYWVEYKIPVFDSGSGPS